MDPGAKVRAFKREGSGIVVQGVNVLVELVGPLFFARFHQDPHTKSGGYSGRACAQFAQVPVCGSCLVPIQGYPN
jgi:hypothetical protein